MNCRSVGSIVPLWVLLAGLSSGCSSHRASYTPMASPIVGMEEYRILQVDAVTVAPGELELLMDAGALLTTRAAFIEDFTKHRVMPAVVATSPETEDVLIVRTTVASWDPGDAGARFFVGFAGAAKLALNMELVDKATQTRIGRTTVSMKESGHGCDAGAMGRKMARSVREFIKKRGM